MHSLPRIDKDIDKNLLEVILVSHNLWQIATQFADNGDILEN